MTDATLNDVFEDNQAEETEAKEVAAPADEPEAKETEAEEVEVEQAEPTTAKDAEPREWTKKAVLDERRKRQALEAEVAKLKQAKPESKEEEGESDVGTIILRERINNSRELMIETKADYEEMETVFLDMAKENPSLVSEMNRSHNPAKFAYTKAKEHSDYLEFKATKDSDEYKEFLEYKAQKKDAPKDKPEDKRKASAVKVPDLTKAAARGKNSEEPEQEGDLKTIMADAPF